LPGKGAEKKNRLFKSERDFVFYEDDEGEEDPGWALVPVDGPS
jgi:hypothetical protein